MMQLKAGMKLIDLEKKCFLEKQLWQEIENKSGYIYPLSGHVIVRGESVEREETRLGLYVHCKIGGNQFPPPPSSSPARCLIQPLLVLYNQD